jgi:hypothetical protein
MVGFQGIPTLTPLGAVPQFPPPSPPSPAPFAPIWAAACLYIARTGAPWPPSHPTVEIGEEQSLNDLQITEKVTGN